MPRPPDLSIVGLTYNNLKVISYTDQRNSYGRGLYLCQCLLCGGERLATKANLIRGEIKDCGCTKHQPRSDTTNLVGRRFGRLEVTGTTVKDGKMRYICHCDCGNDTTVAPQSLTNGSTTSCGCLHKGEDAAIKKLYVSGTAPCKLDPTKLRSTNTSGVTGVYYSTSRGKWCAEIMFRHKKYSLGRYDRKEDAAAARKEAEEQIFGDFLRWYNESYCKEDPHN